MAVLRWLPSPSVPPSLVVLFSQAVVPSSRRQSRLAPPVVCSCSLSSLGSRSPPSAGGWLAAIAAPSLEYLWLASSYLWTPFLAVLPHRSSSPPLLRPPFLAVRLRFIHVAALFLGRPSSSSISLICLYSFAPYSPSVHSMESSSMASWADIAKKNVSNGDDPDLLEGISDKEFLEADLLIDGNYIKLGLDGGVGAPSFGDLGLVGRFLSGGGLPSASPAVPRPQSKTPRTAVTS